MAKPLGITLPIRLGANGYFSSTSDVMEQVKTNLTNLLLTQRGERVFQPEFGCDLSVTLFNLSTDDGLASAQAAIETAVGRWMPFVRIDAVKVLRTTENAATISLAYTLLTSNTSDSVTLVI